ncbi:MAG: hypothetical protein IJ315_05495 [Firmicutes bacterium]|nr:hypothetical protein [Bacillota bacterium]
MKRHARKFLLSLFTPLFAVGILLYFLAALENLSKDQSLEDKQQLETALTRAAVACYAAEGIYPPSLEYLVEHYGVQINTDLYTVKYELFASNLMPDITVLENNYEKTKK